MKRSWLGLATLALTALSLTACPPRGDDLDLGTDADGGGDMRKADMSVACKADPLPAVDFAVAPTGQVVKPGDIGTPCTKNTDCKQGTNPVCWTGTLFNAGGLLETPGGYCSSVCTNDASCGPDNLCLDFGMARGKACIAGCGDAVTCRHPGYSCAYLDQVDNNIITGCWPNGNLGCNPKQDTCTDPRYGQPGGCWRQAIEDEGGGLCLQTCSVGDPCDNDIFDNTLQCLYIDFTDSGDGFRGTLCFPNTDAPKDPGAACQFSNECQDGYQCDNRMPGGNRKCEKMCNLKGRSPRCSTGQSCTKVFPGCEAGLCKAE